MDFLGIDTGFAGEIAGGIPTDGTTGNPSLDSTIGQSDYEFNSRFFPLELGSDQSFNGHYVVININVQEASKMGGGVPGASNLNYTQLNGEYSTTDVLRYNIDPGLGYNVPSVGLPDFAKFGIPVLERLNIGTRPRFTRRIKESIALYMPNSELTFTDVHAFEDISLTKFAISAAKATIGGVAAFGGAGVALARGTSIADGGLGAYNAVGGVIDAFAGVVGNVAQVTGFPINPKVEVLFSNTSQRSFAFDFLFAPSSEAESLAIKNIVQTLRFHAAPELQDGQVSSFFYIPPAEFDITFYNRGVQNTNIPKISTCVLEQIDYSVAPQGVYSTFSNGHPVASRLVLRFKETEVMHKRRIAQGF